MLSEIWNNKTIIIKSNWYKIFFLFIAVLHLVEVRIHKHIQWVLRFSKFKLLKTFSNPTVFVYSGYNKIPQNGWLKQQKFIFIQFWRLEVQDQGAIMVVSPESSLPGLQKQPSCCVLTWPFQCAYPEAPSLMSFPLLIRMPILLY